MVSIKKLAWIAIFSACLLGTFHSRWHGVASPASRLGALFAARSGRLEINDWLDTTGDTAVRDGRHYSDKAPGPLALGLLPAWAVGRVLKACGVPEKSPTDMLATSWVVSFVVECVPLALGMTMLAASLVRSGRVRARAALISAIGLTFGGMPWAYCTAVWSNALVIGLIAAALALLRSFEDSEPSAAETLMGGACLGMAMASEYVSGIVVVAIAIDSVLRRRARAWRLAVGALPALALIPVYSWLTIGTPFNLPYSFNQTFPEMRHGLYAIKLPDVQTLANLLFSPERGLFIWSVFVVLAIPGMIGLWREKRLVLLCGVVPALLIIVISGRVWDWQAGLCYGPRLTSSMIPLLMLPCAKVADSLPRTSLGLALLSVCVTLFAVSLEPLTSPLLHDLLYEEYLPRIQNGIFAYSLPGLTGLRWPWTALLWLLAFAALMTWAWKVTTDVTCGRNENQRDSASVQRSGACETEHPKALELAGKDIPQ